MSSIEHIILFTFLFFFFILITKRNQNYINRNYWRVSILPIIAYFLIIGMRYGWGDDYLWYKRRIENPYYYGNEDPGFLTLNLFLNSAGLNYVGVYIVYALLQIVGAFILVKSYKENKYMLALFLPATLIFTTALIRQSVATSFIYVAMFYLHKKNYLLLMLMLLVAYTIHPGSLIFVTVCIVFFFLYDKNVVPLKISLPLYFLTALNTNLFADYIATPMSSLLSRYQTNIVFMNEYLKKTDDWFGKGAIIDDWYQGSLTLFLSMIFHVGIIIAGSIALKYRNNNYIVYIYNAVVIGFILLRLFWPIELMHRITDPLTMMYFIPLGYSFYEYFHKSSMWSKNDKLLFRNSFVCIVIYLVLYCGRFIFLYPQSDFFWNHISSYQFL